MADKKISELDAITGASTAADDYFVVVDTSGSVTKKISRAELNNAIEQDVLAQVSITDLGSDLNTNGNNILFGDGDKSIFGAGSDLQIYHDSSASYIVDSGTGSLNIHGTDINLKDADGNSYINMSDNGTGGTVTIRHNTAVKLNTKTDGVLITGELQADSLDINGSADIAGTAKSDLVVVDSTGGATPTYSHTNNGEGITLRYNDDSGARAADIVAIGNNPAGATMAMRFFLNPNSTDAAAEVMRIQNGNVGIGTASPDSLLELYKAGTSELMIGSDNAGTAQLSFYEGNSSTKEGFLKYDGANNNVVLGTSGAANALVIPRDTGNVGIGTASPNATVAFDVNGAARFGNTTDGVVIENSTGAYGIGNASYIRRNQSTGNLELVAGSTAARNMLFKTKTNGAESARINANGSLGVGSTLTTAGVVIEAQGTNGWNLNTVVATTAGIGHIVFSNGNGVVGSIVTSGTATAYNTASDYRLKENITAITSATDRLNQLNPVRFNFIADADTIVDGFIAHEVATVIPEAISGEKDEVDADGNAVMQSIDQSKLVPLLTAALQEALTKIDQLETRITALEA